MSFILDALKKSESERHRNSGPVLMDVRVAPPRRRLPTWAWVIAAVLALNLLVLTFVLWLAPHRTTTTKAAVVAPPAATAVQAPVQAPVATPAAAVAQQPAPIVNPPVPDAPVTGSTTTPAPVTPAPGAPAPGAVPAIDVNALPKVQDLISAGVSLPELQMSLHVFDAVPASRYVRLNNAKLHEGEFTPEGVKVVQITTDGVVLEWRGRRMFLGAGG